MTDTSSNSTPEAARSDHCPAPIFIGGFMRSGTSFVMKLLQSHPQCTGFSLDAHVVGPLLDAWLPDRPRNDLHTGMFAALGRDEARLRHFTRAQWYHIYRYAGYPVDERRIVEKTPMSEAIFPRVGTLFPEANFVALLRHPHDAMRSAIAHALIFHEQQDSVTQKIKHHLHQVFRFDRLHRELMRSMQTIEAVYKQMEGRLLVVQYDDLVKDVEGGLRAILETCDLDTSPDALRRSIAGAGAREGEKAYWQRLLGDEYDSEEFDRRFRTTLTDAQRAHLDREAVPCFERVAACCGSGPVGA